MFARMKVPRDEETERREKLQSEKLIETAVHMLHGAVERHDDAMERGRHEEADGFSETAAWWFGALTERNP